jgi:hypothetical protein
VAHVEAGVAGQAHQAGHTLVRAVGVATGEVFGLQVEDGLEYGLHIGNSRANGANGATGLASTKYSLTSSIEQLTLPG